MWRTGINGGLAIASFEMFFKIIINLYSDVVFSGVDIKSFLVVLLMYGILYVQQSSLVRGQVRLF